MFSAPPEGYCSLPNLEKQYTNLLKMISPIDQLAHRRSSKTIKGNDGVRKSVITGHKFKSILSKNNSKASSMFKITRVTTSADQNLPENIYTE